MQVVLIGAVGGGNFGDELILNLWADFYQSVRPHADVVVDGFAPSYLSRPNSNPVMQADPGASIWAWLNRYHKEFLILGDGRATIGKDFWSNEAVKNELRNLASTWASNGVRVVHLIGGGYINALWPENTLLLGALAKIKHIHPGCVVTGTGLGLFPAVPKWEQWVDQGIDKFDYLDVRDEASRIIVKGSGRVVSYTGDDVFLALDAPELPGGWHALREPALIICLQRHLLDGSALFERLLSRAVVDAIPKNIKNIIFVECAPGDYLAHDSGASERLIAAGFTITDWRHPQTLAEGIPYHSGGFAISSRYHPHLIMSAKGMPGIAISDRSYYSNKHQAVAAYGSAWRLLTGAWNSGDVSCALKYGAPGDGGWASQWTTKKMQYAKRLADKYEQLSVQ